MLSQGLAGRRKKDHFVTKKYLGHFFFFFNIALFLNG